jgi:hypothetical protein
MADTAKLPSVLLAIVVGEGDEMRVQCLTSLSQLLDTLMTTGAFTVDLAYVKDTNEALDVLHKTETLTAALIVHHDAGFDPRFATRALESGKSLVVCAMPQRAVDWVRVRERIADPDSAEDPRFVGNVYNVKVDNDKGDPKVPSGVPSGYAAVAEVLAADVLWVRREAVVGIAARHPEILAEPTSGFCMDTIRAGKLVPALAGFLAMHAGEVWTDLDHQGITTGAMDFAGVVGARDKLR